MIKIDSSSQLWSLMISQDVPLSLSLSLSLFLYFHTLGNNSECLQQFYKQLQGISIPPGAIIKNILLSTINVVL